MDGCNTADCVEDSFVSFDRILVSLLFVFATATAPAPATFIFLLTRLTGAFFVVLVSEVETLVSTTLVDFLGI